MQPNIQKLEKEKFSKCHKSKQTFFFFLFIIISPSKHVFPHLIYPTEKAIVKIL